MTDGSDGSNGGGYGSRLHAHLRALATLVQDLQPDRYTGPDAAQLAVMFAWGERLCTTGKALAAQRVAATGAWKPSGERSAAHWLARIAGQTTTQAAGTIENARRMVTQPDIDHAARAGQLSEQQHRAVSSAAAKNPDKTGELLDQARGDDLAALQARARQIRLTADQHAENDHYRRIHAHRYLRFWTDDDGDGRLHGRFTPDALAHITTALAPFTADITNAARRAGTPHRPDAHTADALVALEPPRPAPDPPPSPALFD